jgi:hypothetical protein
MKIKKHLTKPKKTEPPFGTAPFLSLAVTPVAIDGVGIFATGGRKLYFSNA